ncbi:TMEM175 family protein [Arthrobacter koreensis]|uniref:TMEM175 family protein n=1 Tax=Arthrobacter koreensis TaxID=199136 RepID=UPI002DB69290|nr:TMEM175 family protein [Arthrobacter koreensis]MEB7504918.1 TMEM175 family protein [Arthrobacter koreensis]
MTENSGSFKRGLDSGPDIERTMFFSDAVFAIAMTLLAVDIKAPDVPAGELGRAVLEQRPEFFAYALSFAVAGAYWLSHHRLFRLLKGFTGGLQRLNLLLLFFVALLAYATDMLALQDNTSLGVVIYAAALGLIGSVNTLMWSYCRRRGLFRDDVNPDLLRYARVRAPVTPAVFLLSIPIALLSPAAAELSWLSILVINLGLRFWGRRRRSAGADA